MGLGSNSEEAITMGKVYAILGSGMQGKACAYDIAKFGDPKAILMADVSGEQAQCAATKLNRLLGSDVCQPVTLDALDTNALRSFLKEVDVVVSCVPYWMHPKIAPIAVETKTNMVDMGGNTDITHATLKAAEGAAAAGVCVVPDTGLAPGMVNNIGMYLMEKLDEAEDVRMYCGGLPQHPKPPFNYMLVFNIEGLVVEYDGQATILRDGEIAFVDTLTEMETIEHPKLGTLEAFVTSGGTSTAPYTFKGKVTNYVYKTFRYPGHCAMMRMFKDCGFWGKDCIDTRAGKAVPIEVFHSVMGPYLESDDRRDLIVVRGVAKGKKDGKPAEFQLDILDLHDDQTDFSAMERMTGFSTAIYAIEIAKGTVAPGAIEYEKAMTGHHYMAELRKRGFDITEK
jgi:lysine 6-dehydrogenase